VLQNLKGFHKGRKLNLVANLRSLKILFPPHTLFKFGLPWFIKKLVTRRIYLSNSKLYTQTNKKLCYQTQEGLWNFFKTSSSQHYPYSLPFFQKYYKHPIYYPSFHHLLGLIIILLPKKVVETNILKIWIENYVQEKEPQMIWIRLLKRKKRKEVKEDLNSVANGRFQCLVALERFHCLVANGRKRRNTFSPLPTFPPTNFILTFIFSIDLKVLFYHGSRPLLMHFLLFPWPIN